MHKLRLSWVVCVHVFMCRHNTHRPTVFVSVCIDDVSIVVVCWETCLGFCLTSGEGQGKKGGLPVKADLIQALLAGFVDRV